MKTIDVVTTILTLLTIVLFIVGIVLSVGVKNTAAGMACCGFGFACQGVRIFLSRKQRKED